MVRAWSLILPAVILLAGLLPGLYPGGSAEAHRAGTHTHAENEELRAEEYAAPAAGEIPSGREFERALDARLRALEYEVRKLREAVEQPGLAEIVGGLGWIAGLAALAYAWKRRERN